MPTPNYLLPLHKDLVIILLETLINDALSMPFQLEIFVALSLLVLIVRSNTFVVFEGHMDMHVQDIL